MEIHKIKIDPIYYEKVALGIKTFEVRLNDRNYKVNDLLLMQEYTKHGYTGNVLLCKVKYILKHSEFMQGIKKDYVVMAIERIDLR